MTDRPNGIKTVSNKWVLTKKPGENGSVRFKARLCARGFSQRPGYDFQVDGTSSPVVKMSTVRTVLALAAKQGLKEAKDNRERIAREMTPKQIAKALKSAQAWKQSEK